MTINTSKKNKELVSKFTRKFKLGSENHIARMAFAYSISSSMIDSDPNQMELSKIQDSGGKVYPKSVFFGKHFNLYCGLVCVLHKLHSTDRNIPKYIKMHVDNGLELIDRKLHTQDYNEPIDFIQGLIKNH